MFGTTNDLVTIDEITELANYQRISVRIKVVAEEEAITVKKGLVKQEYLIADSTGTTKIVTWEDNVGILLTGESYKLSGLMVRAFKGRKYLSIPKDEFKIDDIGLVDDGSTEFDKKKHLLNVTVIGVRYLDNYKGCYACSGKVPPRSDTLGECNRCESIQRLERCTMKTSAKVDVETNNEVHTISPFHQLLMKFAMKVHAQLKHSSLANHLMPSFQIKMLFYL